MNTANIKKYAPKARNNFIAAVTKQAARYGITAKGTKPVEQRGDIALIGEKAFPKAIVPARKALKRMVEQMGFAQAMEQAAYSWFNRLCAIRYMELHDFLDHGRRVLSTADGQPGTPQILDDCLDISLPGLDLQKVAELKLDGNKDEELYRELLLAQCHALHEAMPFLFETLDDATELLLPDNLTKTDSLIRELVSAIPEDDWQDVEIIGWLYQFYISEKKDQVIGKVVKSEDIPAATQLFTPNWIVQYLVQNSVGRQWLQTYPDSPLRNQMPYFIEPGEQPPEVQAQLAETVPDAIDPESIKVLDPACGSGHILVEAYKVLKAIYEERGYRSRDIPQQILKNNLFGLDIDDRAGQLAGFALMMLAREDDRRLFSRVAEGEVTLNVLSLKETGHLNLPQLWQDLNLSGDWQQGSSQSLFESEQVDLSSPIADERYQLLQRTLKRFEEAKTFGSLIEVPEEDAAPLKALVEELEQLARTGDVMQKPAAETLLPYVRQSWMLAQRYDSVIANPPYMGSKAFNGRLKEFLSKEYSQYNKDLFSAFIVKMLSLSKWDGLCGVMTSFVWMFISNFKKLRHELVSNHTLETLVQLHYDAFVDAKAHVCAFTIRKDFYQNFLASFIRLADFPGEKNQAPKVLEAINNPDCGWKYVKNPKSFSLLPGAQIAYWVSGLENFSGPLIGDYYKSGGRNKTHDNEKYTRFHWEVGGDEGRWKLYLNGGNYRKYYGNEFTVVDWSEEAVNFYKSHGGLVNDSLINKKGISWPLITSSLNGFRIKDSDVLYSSGSPVIYGGDELSNYKVLGFMNSKVASYYLKSLNETLNTTVNDVLSLPYKIESVSDEVGVNVELCVSIASCDWNDYEVSSGFLVNPIVALKDCGSVSGSYKLWLEAIEKKIASFVRLEKRINQEYIDAFSLERIIDSDVERVEVTLKGNPHYRYRASPKDSNLTARFKSDSIAELTSFFVGCVMGRYSLDKPGLILASQGENLQDYLHQIPSPRFAPDDDAILPLTDQEWFADDATNRFREFVRVVWGDEHLQESLDFVAESLCLHAIKPKRGESSLDTIRRYLSTQFFKDHLRTYKKRPIYWLFSSGKYKAFECLVYLHRYNEGTLARIRTEYVIPLSAKLNAYAEKLEQDKEASTSAAETKRLEKEIATLHKQQAELAEFDEKLRHYADQRISLDLDDGVKVNYGKFGDLLAEVKAVTGDKPQ